MTIVSRALFLETESSRHTAFFFARPRALAKAKQTDQNIIVFALISRCPSARSPFYSRTSVDHPRRYVPPHRQSSRFPTTLARPAAPARDSRRRAAPGAFAVRRRARDPNTPDAIARLERRGATRLERRGATRRARATRRIRGKTRYRTASSSAAAETRSRVSPDRSRVTRRLGFHEHHRVCVGFSSFPERDPERERGSKPGGRGALVSRSSSATERAPSSTLVFLFSSTLADLARRPASRRRTHATEHDG